VKDYILEATGADSIVLDGEILLMDATTKKPLPFGTLGIHKKSAFKDATVCIFLFDILFLNGKSLLDVPFQKRRKLLESSVTIIPTRIELAESKFMTEEEDLCYLMTKCMREGLEGLVIKDVDGIYEPNARHWIKIKKVFIF
jgi:DNA ligase-3